MTMITPSYLGETIEYSSLHACRSTLEDPTHRAARERCQSHFRRALLQRGKIGGARLRGVIVAQGTLRFVNGFAAC